MMNDQLLKSLHIKKSQIAPSFIEWPSRKELETYSKARNIGDLLVSVAKQIPKKNVAEFVFDCALYYVYNSSEREKISALIDSNFLDYKDAYKNYLVYGAVQKHMTPENMRRIANATDAHMNYIKKVTDLQVVTAQYWQTIGAKIERSNRRRLTELSGDSI
jgi:hypothetical protein